MKNTYTSHLFKQFNQKYFRSELPEIEVSYSPRIVKYGFFFSGYDTDAGICLASILKKNQMALEGVLLHEMVHCRLWVDHGQMHQSLLTNFYANSDLWNEHTYTFLQMEKRVNKMHFGNTKGHEYYVKVMERKLSGR